MTKKISHSSKNSKLITGGDDVMINDTEYTKKVQERLRTSLLSILQFSDAWQTWVIGHSDDVLPEVSPAESFEYDVEPSLKNEKLGSLLRAVISYAKNKKKLTAKEKYSIWHIVICILEKENTEYEEIMNILRQIMR